MVRTAAFVALFAAGTSLRPFSAARAQRSPRDSTHAPAPARGRLLGVYDEASGNPIAGADVTDILTGDRTQTSATGTVSLWFLRAKGSVVQVRKVGYEPWQNAVDPADTTPITVLLKPTVTELPTVLSTAKPDISKDPGLREGFEHRCQAANVSCVREDVIASHPSNTLGDLLVKFPGVIVLRGILAMHSTTGGYCVPNYMIDGHLWNTKAMGGFPIDQPGAPADGSGRNPPPFNTSNVESVEVYPAYGVRPLRFTGNPSCGTIAIWTK